MRILIMEDDLSAAEAMARGLTEAGHEPTLAPDGEQGLKLAGRAATTSSSWTA